MNADNVADVHLADPQLHESDTDQLLFRLLSNAGLSVGLSAPLPIDVLLERAAALAPIILNSTRLGDGAFLQLNADPTIIWTAVDGPDGSAVVLTCGADSDARLVLERLMQPFEQAPRPFERVFISQGETSPSAARILDSAAVVPVWEFEPFAQVSPTPDSPTFPLALRSAAKHWEQPAKNAYARNVTEPTNARFFLTWGGDAAYISVMVSADANAPLWAKEVTADGIYQLDQDSNGSMIECKLTGPYTADTLDQTVDEFMSALEKARHRALADAATPQKEPAPGTSMWQQVEHLRSDPGLARAWEAPDHVPLFTYVEGLRFATGEDHKQDEARLVAWLRDQGRVDHDVWRGDQGQTLSPAWITVRGAVMDAATGRAVMAAHLSREKDGWIGHPPYAVYIGSTRTGALIPVDASIEVISVDLNPQTGCVAALHHLGTATFGVSLFEVDGRRRFLTVVGDLSGTEDIHFSSGGRWLLIPRFDRSVLIDVTTGAWANIDVPNATWWPLADASLICIHHEDGNAQPRRFSLVENRYVADFPAVLLDTPMLPAYPYIWDPTASPDGQILLARAPVGVTPEYQQEHGTGTHLVKIKLDSGQGSLITTPFLNPAETIERDINRIRWVARNPAPAEAELHPDLIAALQPPIQEHEWLAPDRWADEAEQFLVGTLNAAIDRTKADQDDLSDLMPEVLAYLKVLAEAPEQFGHQRDWLMGLQETTANLIVAGNLSGPLAHYWRAFGAAVKAAESQRPDLIHPVDAYPAP